MMIDDNDNTFMIMMMMSLRGIDNSVYCHSMLFVENTVSQIMPHFTFRIIW